MFVEVGLGSNMRHNNHHDNHHRTQYQFHYHHLHHQILFSLLSFIEVGLGSEARLSESFSPEHQPLSQVGAIVIFIVIVIIVVIVIIKIIIITRSANLYHDHEFMIFQQLGESLSRGRSLAQEVTFLITE